MRVTLVPIGRPDPDALRALGHDLAATGFDVEPGESELLPDAAYDPRRNQYRAAELLAPLRSLPGDRVLGVTDADLYEDDLNFVLGLAERYGRAAVISLARLGLGADPARARARALKEAVHEIGHTLGLGHCADKSCVMHFSNRLADTDRKTSRFCATCLGRLKRAG
jgi:archaemetzincin